MVHKNRHKKVVFLDRDGTLNPDPGYISSLHEYTFYKNSLKALKRLSQYGYQFIIITNQSGVGRGYFKEEALLKIHHYIKKKCDEKGISLLGIYYCPHQPEANCDCRKPKTGLFKKASMDHSLDLKGCYFIGDSMLDIEAGRTLGLKLILVRTGQGEKTELELKIKNRRVDFVGDNLDECINYIIKREELR